MTVRIGTILLAGGLTLGSAAQDKAMPDAQVEANVLRALAGAPELSTQNIKTTTVYGVVTLSGSANDEASRSKAEQLAARAPGVKKVVDELTLGGAPAVGEGTAPAGAGDPHAGMVLQSDGTYAQDPNMQQQPQQSAPAYDAQNGAAGPPPRQNAPYDPQNGPAGPPPQQNAPYDPQNGQAGPPPPPYGSAGGQYPPRRPMYNNGTAYAGPAPVQGGQEAGRAVTIPGGTMVRIRINQGLSTHRTQPGSTFDGTVLNDVVADGAVAIPRGAAVQGTVVQSKDSGALKGRGELALQLTKLTLGGQSYTLVSDVWQRDGKDKTTHTVNSAVALGAVGALFGAVAGGGKGAAIGAGVGGAAGVASSATSPSGKVIIPPEAVLTFHLAQLAQVSTVSEQEMSRLSYAAGPGQPQPVRRRAYPAPYYAPYGPYYYPR